MKINFKKFRYIILLNIFLVILLICMIYFSNNIEKVQKILGIEIQKEETLPLFSYMIYDYENNDSLGVLVTVNSESGIEYIQKQDGTKIYGNGKNKIGIDYLCAVGVEEKVIIKEIGKDEVEEKILITGSGNESSPILITDAEQLLNIQEIESKTFLNISSDKIYYKLEADIDLSNVEWTPIGTSEKPFEGTLDGDGHTISNLSYSGSDETNVGLFSYITGSLSNIKLDNVNITGKTNTGALVGYNAGTIENITITNAQINGDTASGILVGYNTSIVNNNSVSGNVVAVGDNTGGLIGVIEATGKKISCDNNKSTGSVNGKNNVGGLIGYSSVDVTKGSQQTISISNCYSNSNINATGNNVGGLLGYDYVSTTTNISKCYSTGNISSTGDNIGGLVGFMDIRASGSATGSIENCFSIGSVSGNSNCGGLLGSIDRLGLANVNIINNYACSQVGGTDTCIEPIIGIFNPTTGDGKVNRNCNNCRV